MRISWTQAWKEGVVKEEKNVLGAGVCGSLVLAFLIVALERGGEFLWTNILALP